MLLLHIVQHNVLQKLGLVIILVVQINIFRSINGCVCVYLIISLHVVGAS